MFLYNLELISALKENNRMLGDYVVGGHRGWVNRTFAWVGQ